MDVAVKYNVLRLVYVTEAKSESCWYGSFESMAVNLGYSSDSSSREVKRKADDN